MPISVEFILLRSLIDNSAYMREASYRFSRRLMGLSLLRTIEPRKSETLSGVFLVTARANYPEGNA